MKQTVAGLALAAVTGLAGCGPGHLDMEKVKSTARDAIVKQIGANVKAIKCPEQRELKAGDTFECQVDIDHGTTPVLVTQKDAEGNIQITTPKKILAVGDMEKLMAAYLKQNGNLDANIDCGPKFRPSVPKETFDCTAKFEGTTVGIFNVAVKDDQGNFSYELKVPDAPAAGAETAEE
jgi:hypothetical protein